MKTVLFLGLLLSTLSAHGETEEIRLSIEEKNQIAAPLVVAAKTACHIPAELDIAAKSSLEIYVRQVLFPEDKMLSVAFLKGLTSKTSKHLKYGYCVIVFMGIPNDPGWERAANYYRDAKDAKTLPEVVFAGFDANGAPLVKPLEGPAN